MKILKFFIKKIIFSAFILYFYNYIFVKYNMIIPINLINMTIVSLFGGFGLVGLILFKYFI